MLVDGQMQRERERGRECYESVREGELEQKVTIATIQKRWIKQANILANTTKYIKSSNRAISVYLIVQHNCKHNEM